MRSGRLSLEPNSSESGREIAKGSQDVAFGGLQSIQSHSGHRSRGARHETTRFALSPVTTPAAQLSYHSFVHFLKM